MGSPENYYGVFGLTRGLTTTGTTTTTHHEHDVRRRRHRLAHRRRRPRPGPGRRPPARSRPRSRPNNTIYVRTNTNSATHQFGTFGFTTGGSPPLPSPAANQSLSIVGLEVRLTDAFVSAACASSNDPGGPELEQRDDLVHPGRDAQPRDEHHDRRLHAAGLRTAPRPRRRGAAAHLGPQPTSPTPTSRLRVTASRAARTAGDHLNVDHAPGPRLLPHVHDDHHDHHDHHDDADRGRRTCRVRAPPARSASPTATTPTAWPSTRAASGRR